MFFSIAGAKLYIGTQLADLNRDTTLADFAGQPWVEITGHENLGSSGDVARELEFNDIRNKRIKRWKGTRSATTMDLVFGLNVNDPGQIKLIEANAENSGYAFRIVFDDAPANGTPSERLFNAVVGNLVEQYDAGDEVVKVECPLWVNSNIVRVDAAEPVE